MAIKFNLETLDSSFQAITEGKFFLLSKTDPQPLVVDHLQDQLVNKQRLTSGLTLSIQWGRRVEED